MMRAPRLVTRVPLTITLALIMLVVALLQGNWQHGLSAGDTLRYGLSLDDIAKGDVTALMTSLFITPGGLILIRYVLHVIYAVGLCEWRLGTWRTMAFFIACQFIVTLLYAIVAWSIIRVTTPAVAADLARDAFGPSSGGSACLGYGVSSLAPPWRRRLTLLIVAGFSLKAAVWLEPNNDLTHAIGFPLGCLYGLWIAHRRRGPSPGGRFD